MDKKIEVLMKEYELHKNELMLQIELYNRQTNYIQIFGALLLGLGAILFGTGGNKVLDFFTKDVSIREEYINMLISLFLFFVAFIVLFFVATVTSSSLMFLILRRRMACIENKINSLLEDHRLLEYESRIAPAFLENLSYGKSHLLPHFLGSAWRLFLLITIIIALCIISNKILPPKYSFIYCYFILVFSLLQVYQYSRLYFSKDLINNYIINPIYKTKKASLIFVLLLILLLIIIPFIYLLAK